MSKKTHNDNIIMKLQDGVALLLFPVGKFFMWPLNKTCTFTLKVYMLCTRDLKHAVTSNNIKTQDVNRTWMSRPNVVEHEGVRFNNQQDDKIKQWRSCSLYLRHVLFFWLVAFPVCLPVFKWTALGQIPSNCTLANHFESHHVLFTL